ncbi:dihydrodipicolinate synthase family protein [Oleiharenicola lentus]|uniref:dihydrodipicolinate synthase family protein n=1 Tax=Oleiharenicola lentus TaxID=2508720 RepID=UPI003F677EE1
MSASVPRKGILAALWLPTDASGNLLVAELSRHLSFLKSKGVYGVLALGSTGEFPQLDIEQRKRALATVAELAAPLPVSRFDALLNFRRLLVEKRLHVGHLALDPLHRPLERFQIPQHERPGGALGIFCDQFRVVGEIFGMRRDIGI